jgi:hypothetical protein
MYAKSFYHWFNGGFYQQAHDVLISHMIISTESLPEKFKDLQVVVQNLEKNKDHIFNWDRQGKVIFNFLELKNELEAYFSEFFDEFEEFKLSKDQ